MQSCSRRSHVQNAVTVVYDLNMLLYAEHASSDMIGVHWCGGTRSQGDWAEVSRVCRSVAGAMQWPCTVRPTSLQQLKNTLTLCFLQYNTCPSSSELLNLLPLLLTRHNAVTACAASDTTTRTMLQFGNAISYLINVLAYASGALMGKAWRKAACDAGSVDAAHRLSPIEVAQMFTGLLEQSNRRSFEASQACRSGSSPPW